MVGAPAKRVRELVRRSVVLFLCDDSGSMYGGWGDPTGVRYAAALSLLGLMDRSGGGRAAVVHWGTEAPLSLAVAPTDVRRDRRALKSALTIPPTLGGTDLPRALQRARNIATSLEPDENLVCFVLTDGIESVTTATHAAIAALPAGSVHMILVDRSGGCDGAMEAAWKTVAFGSFTRLRTFSTPEMAQQLAVIFATSLGLEMPKTKADTTNTTRRKS
jgi:Mg-chelatase subunit ChlD